MTDDNDLSPIDKLPIDVIIHIMSYLSVSDRMAAGLMNKVWQEASLTTKFIDQQTILLNQHCMEDLDQILNVFYLPTRRFYHFTFKNIDLGRTMFVWKQLGPEMRSLTLISCELSERNLVDILKSCVCLKVLCINSCRECLMSGQLLDNKKDVKMLSKRLQSLEELDLSHNRYLSDALFNRLVAICPNLKLLSLLDCQISFHCGLYKKFYPDNTVTSYDSQSVLTFLNVLRYIKQQSNKLKHINLGHTLIDGTALANLLTLRNLKLESLKLQNCTQLTISGIKALSEYQTCLKVLDVSLCTYVTDESLILICKSLKALEDLSVRRCSSLTDYGIQHIRLLSRLRKLDISECEQLTGQCITMGLSSNLENETEGDTNEQNPDMGSTDSINNKSCTKKYLENDKLQRLSVNALNLDEEAIECIAVSFPNLRALDISFCFNAVTDKTVQMIFEKAVFLRQLKMSQCYKVSDVGLTGTRVNKEESYIEDIPEVSESIPRISLRSRAEEEIVCEANRKKEVMKLYENLHESSSIKPFFSFALSRLKGLTELDLSGCNRITDVSLRYTIAFPELRILELSKCEITDVGLDHVTKNNPAIEVLNLTQCHSITDIGVSYIIRRLPRLKYLFLKGCSRLTDDTLNFIKLYSKSLRHLDVRYCPYMTIACLESLSGIYVKYTKQMDENVQFPNAIPIPPALPNVNN